MTAALRGTAVATDAGLASRPLLLLVVIGALSLLPFVVLLMTSFVKIAVVLSVLKSALGTPQIPPSQVVTGVALILTLFVMAPTGMRMFQAVEPLLGQSAGADLLSGQTAEALSAATAKAKEPLREFLLKNASARDRAVFHSLALRMRTAQERAGISEQRLPGRGARVSDLRAASRVRDWFLALRAFPGRGHGDCEPALGAGHAHAVTHHRVAALQASALCAR